MTELDQAPTIGVLEPTDEWLDLEFAYTPYDVPKCRNPYRIEMWCKRPAGHEGNHAAGFGSERRRWSD